jgi:hypothetical protein
MTRHSPLMTQAIGADCVLFFGWWVLYAARKLFDPAPGLVVDDEGLVDNSSALAAGRMPWADIADIRMVKVQRQRFLAIELHDPRQIPSAR